MGNSYSKMTDLHGVMVVPFKETWQCKHKLAEDLACLRDRGAIIVNEHDFQARGLPEEGWKFLVVDGPYGPDGKEALPYHVQSAAQDVFPDAPCRRALDEAVMRHGLGCWEGVKPVKHGRGDEYIWPIRFLTHLPFDRRKKDFSNLLYLFEGQGSPLPDSTSSPAGRPFDEPSPAPSDWSWSDGGSPSIFHSQKTSRRTSPGQSRSASPSGSDAQTIRGSPCRDSPTYRPEPINATLLPFVEIDGPGFEFAAPISARIPPRAANEDSAAMTAEASRTAGHTHTGANDRCRQLPSSVARPSVLPALLSKSPSPVGLALFEPLAAVPVAGTYLFSPPAPQEPRSVQRLQHPEKGAKRLQADTGSAKVSPDLSGTEQSVAAQGEPSVSATMSADRTKRRRLQRESGMARRTTEQTDGDSSDEDSEEGDVGVAGQQGAAVAEERPASATLVTETVNVAAPISPTISDISDAVSSIHISPEVVPTMPAGICEAGRLDLQRAIENRAKIEADVAEDDRPCFWAHVARFATVRPEEGTGYLNLQGRNKKRGREHFMRAMPQEDRPAEWRNQNYMWSRYYASFVLCLPYLHVLVSKEKQAGLSNADAA